MKNLVREVVHSINPTFAFQERSELRGLINLKDNENQFGGFHKFYPENSPTKLTLAYIEALEVIEQHNREINSEQFWNTDTVLLTRGASDALDLVFRTFFEPGKDSVAVTTPNFKLFDELAWAYQVDIERVQLKGDQFNRLKVQQLASLPVKGIILCDPNNPMGTSIEFQDIIELIDTFDGLVVIDEAYVEYTNRMSYRHLIKNYSNLLVVRSLSKALGMANLRLGAIFGNPNFIAAIRKVRLPFALPGLVVEAALEELANPILLKQQINIFIKERNRLAAALINCPGIKRVFAEAGFVCVQAGADIAHKLQQAKLDVVVNPMGHKGYIRISVGTETTNDLLIQTLSNNN